MEYKIVESDDVESLETDVNVVINLGYQPIGGPFQVQCSCYDTAMGTYTYWVRYAQALKKILDKPE